MNQKLHLAIVLLPGVAAGGAAELNAYFDNLDNHNSYSDGSGIRRGVCEYARHTGRLDFLAITEHNHKSAAL